MLVSDKTTWYTQRSSTICTILYGSLDPCIRNVLILWRAVCRLFIELNRVSHIVRADSLDHLSLQRTFELVPGLQSFQIVTRNEGHIHSTM
jgi:hypothetical protein